MYLVRFIKVTACCCLDSREQKYFLYFNLLLGWDLCRWEDTENVTALLTGFTYPLKKGRLELGEVKIRTESDAYCVQRYREAYQSDLPSGLHCVKTVYLSTYIYTKS
jgi:hypothetical protein